MWVFPPRAFLGLDLSTTTDLSALVILLPDEAGGYDVRAEFEVPPIRSPRGATRTACPMRSGPSRISPHDPREHGGLLLHREADSRAHGRVRGGGGRGRSLERPGLHRPAPGGRRAGGRGPADPDEPDAATKEWESVLSGQLHHDGHPILRWCVSNAVVDLDGNGNLKPSKRRSTERIDGVSRARDGARPGHAGWRPRSTSGGSRCSLTYKSRLLYGGAKSGWLMTSKSGRSTASAPTRTDPRAPKLIGYAIRTNVLSEDLGGFRERITPEAVTRALAASQDARRPPQPRPRSTSSAGAPRRRSASRPTPRGSGSRWTCPSPSAALVESVPRGDLTGASFAFSDAKDDWDTRATPPIRTIRDMRLREISAGVVWPAYPADPRHGAPQPRGRPQTGAPHAGDHDRPRPVPELVPPVAPVVTRDRARRRRGPRAGPGRLVPELGGGAHEAPGRVRASAARRRPARPDHGAAERPRAARALGGLGPRGRLHGARTSSWPGGSIACARP